MRKINCKHGLSYKEEIQARRLKDKIIEGDRSQIIERLKSLYTQYNSNGSFYDYIKENDTVMYSAFERAGGIEQLYHIIDMCGIF